MSTAVSSAPVTSRWYGQGRAVDVARRLESLTALPSPPAPVGVITARPDDVTVTFVQGLRGPLPPPWHGAGSEAWISWDAIPTDGAPNPDRPVYLVVFGTTDDGALIGLNLAAFSRIRLTGDPATTTAVITRWVLELLSTHPGIRVGLTRDAWSGPWTTRVHPVAPGQVPDVDVLVCGAQLTYAERAQIVAAATSPVLLDLGDDAAVTATWSITCGADNEAQISRGPAAKPMSATLIVPTTDVVERCAELIASPAQPAPPADDRDDEDTASPVAAALPSPAEAAPGDGGAIDFFDDADPDSDDPDRDEPPWRTDEPATTILDEQVATPVTAEVPAAPMPAVDSPAPTGNTSDAAADGPHDAQPESQPAPLKPHEPEPESGPAPAVAPVWNRILGRVTLSPPHPGGEPGPRERRLNELLVYIQLHRWVGTDDIIRAVFNGAATEKTVTQQMSLLRKRLGVLYPAGPKALPPMSEGTYNVESVVCSDWKEFDRLVEIHAETTSTAHLVAAMELVTGPALGGIPSKEWPWAADLREQMRDRVPAAAVVLARRHRDAGRFVTAVDIARKGLWYDSVRQDLWEIALSSALDGRDKETFRALRGQYLNTIAGPDRDPAVLDLTGRSG